MQRYFLNGVITDKYISITEHYHHMIHVMRMKVDDQCYVVDTQANCYLVKIDAINKGSVMVSCLEKIDRAVELPVHVTIAFGLPKGDKIEWLIQKATELGAYQFIPFDSQFSVVKWDSKKSDKKVQRLQTIAKEASEQSHRVVVPQVNTLIAFKQLLEESKQFHYVIVAYEESAKLQEHTQFKTILKQLKPGDNILIVFGSEGGLSSGEVKQLIEYGAVCVGLGHRIMRAETAPLYALSAISYELELK